MLMTDPLIDKCLQPKSPSLTHALPNYFSLAHLGTGLESSSHVWFRVRTNGA